ncbi:exodeoxyribonuclease VII large subunit [Salinibacterium hongtaonis]|uniref:Exodeoxyribonuclease 7 large subunit n=1 Tax=Homoserinimonas hongtaonis TaxID=2079791 RepID=A0A2U1T3J4_9MICO|nr:exodeoxyribonuclease VII large subunit [Salinibacterium hongtaonis]PWB98444.1 exodeoxyribonuclease VII large subunit [Salinibacterium hongtaonis]
MIPDTEALPTVDTPWPVSLLSTKIKGWIERLGAVWVEGEITQWGVSGGTVYGKLKDLDVDATVSFTIWSSVRSRVPADLGQGARVVALVKPNYWVKGGTLTMQVLEMRHVGLGDLLERLERLRQKLRAEGLFDASRKKALPFLPAVVGLVTGKDSDAEKDVLRNAQLRWPAVEFRVAHAAVQGDRAVTEVIAAIRRLDSDPEVDVIIVARGGGDFQNLLVFSDEALVRAASDAVTPLVSAIGHENDRPLLDDVADLRASTPTDAAKRVVPDVAEEMSRVQQARARIGMRLTSRISTEIDKIEQLRTRPVLSSGDWIIDTRSDELGRWVGRSRELVELRLERSQATVGELASRLRALSPQATLDRGYAIAQMPDGSVLRTADDATVGGALTLTLARGSVGAEVTSTSPERASALSPTTPDSEQPRSNGSSKGRITQ